MRLALLLLAAAAAAVAAAPPRAFAVAKICGSDAVANTANVFCATGVCSPTLVRMTTPIEVTAGGCEFDLGGRALSIEKTFQMTGLGFIKVFNAGDITLTATGKLKARGDFVKPSGYIIGGGLISLVSSGTIDLNAGNLDVSGDSAGSMSLIARQDVVIRGNSILNGSGNSSYADLGSRYTDGGELEVVAETGSITINGDISVKGLNAGAGGLVDLTAGTNITITRTIDVSGGGSDGGEFDAVAGDNIVITNGGINADSTVGGGFGGTISLDAGEDYLGGVVAGGGIDINAASLLLRGSATDTYGGDGGELDMLAAGRVRLFGAGVAVRADAATNFDGSGGSISIDSGDAEPSRLGALDGDIEIGGVVSMRSGFTGGSGGSLDVSAGRDAMLTAAVDLSGTDMGGDVLIEAGRATTINGVVTTRATSADGEGGYVDIAAGLASDEGAGGNLAIQKNIVATSGTSHGSGQSISLRGCGLAVAANVKIDGSGGVSPLNGMQGGSDIELVSRRAMQLGSGSQYVSPPGGSVTTTRLPGVTPVIGSGVVFNPARIDNPVVSGPFPACPICGDGIRQVGETCDKGAGADGACCNATCTQFLCPTVTATPTVGPTHTPTPSRTATPLGTRTATPVPPTSTAATTTPLATPVPSATATPTRTATPTGTATVTVTPTVTPTATPTPAAAVIDHYKCYKAPKSPGTAAFAAREVTVTDGVETKRTRVIKTTEFCNAVDKDGQGIQDPDAHLQCYQIKDAPGQARFVPSTGTFDNELGAGQQLVVKQTKRLCVPAGSGGVAAAASVDRLKCYTVKTPAGAPKLAGVTTALRDAFEQKLAKVLEPESVCNAADVDGQAAVNPAAQLHCYKIKQAPGQTGFQKRTVQATNEFGNESLQAQKATLLCVPSTREAPPTCGDGFRDPGEQCDDGGIVPGDGCDDHCRLEACGNGVRDNGEECDDGAANGSDECCSTLCRLVDPDGDGICTAQDRCPEDVDNDSDDDGYCVGPVARPPAIGTDDPCSRRGTAGDWIKPKVVFTKLDQAPGLQKVKISGAITIPTGGSPIAPQARGVHVRVLGPTGTLVIDQHVPAGVYTAAHPVGWKVSGAPPNKFTYFDKVSLPPSQNGIRKVVVTDKSAKVPGLVMFSIDGQRGDYPLAPGESPITVAIELNDTGNPPGAMPGVDQCGEVRFLVPPAVPSCQTGVAKLSCK